jgi:CheY-like chemotaxis protein
VEPGALHDFKNLLTVISGHSELLLARLKEDDPLWRSADAIRKAVESGAILTTQLLAATPRPDRPADIVELNDLVASVARMLDGPMGPGIELNVRLDTAAGRVRVSRTEIEQVIVNLAVNARDAMPDGGRLTIETARLDITPGVGRRPSDPPPGAWAMVSVHDTGTGMEPWIATRLFEPYFTTKSGRGTGLGLATAQAIARRHGGDIRVTTAVGRGSTFRVYVPRVAELAARQNGASSPVALRGSETILVVEDELELRDLVREILEVHGYTVLQARSTEEAETLVAGHPGALALAIADVFTPGRGPRELLATLRATRPRVKVLYVSGHSDEEIARRAGPLDGPLLRKPFAVGALTRKIREILDAL